MLISPQPHFRLLPKSVEEQRKTILAPCVSCCGPGGGAARNPPPWAEAQKSGSWAGQAPGTPLLAAIQAKSCFFFHISSGALQKWRPGITPHGCMCGDSQISCRRPGAGVMSLGGGEEPTVGRVVAGPSGLRPVEQKDAVKVK